MNNKMLDKAQDLRNKIEDAKSYENKIKVNQKAFYKAMESDSKEVILISDLQNASISLTVGDVEYFKLYDLIDNFYDDIINSIHLKIINLVIEFRKL